MAKSDYEASGAPKTAHASEEEKRAEKAATGLKGQIAALRDQVRQAQKDLRGDIRGRRESRSFNTKD
jgi:hypothetical protein